MKTLLIILTLLSLNVKAQESCKINTTVKEVKEDQNTPVPKELEDAVIVIKTKDGKEKVMSANEFKIVKRKQQFKIKETVVTKTECVTKTVFQPKKHLIFAGVGYGPTEAKGEVDGLVAKAYVKKGPVGSINYMQNNIGNKNLSLGVGIESNATVKGYLGFFLD